MFNPNQILPFATGVGANVLSPDAWGTTLARQQGFQNGLAYPEAVNTAFRQASFAAAMVAQFTADYGPNAVNDDGNLGNFEASFVAALRQIFIGVPVLTDVGAANAIVVNPNPVATGYSVPMVYIVKVLAPNTGNTTVNVSGNGPKPLLTPSQQQMLPGAVVAGGYALISYDGIGFQLLSAPANIPTPAQVIHYGVDVSLTPNVVVAAVDATVVAYSTPLFFCIKIANPNTGPSNVSLNTLGPVPITVNTSALVGGEMSAGKEALFCYDGVQAQLLNPTVTGGSGGSIPANYNNITGQIRPYWLAVSSAVVGSPPGSPATGDTYLLPVGSTGAWTGLDGRLAQWTGSAWVYQTYPTGSLVCASDTKQYYSKVGSLWVPVQLPSSGRLFFFGQL